jgi:hypothetical protein
MKEEKYLFSLACDCFDYEIANTSQSSVIWQMINLRRPLQFRYYSRDNRCSGNYSLIAKWPVIEPLNYNEATHVHLAYSDH